jgi:DNA-binding transcriptional ArsR family regulator
MVTQLERPDVYKALADPTRRTILSNLIRGELSVNAIARGFDVSRPAISKHLRLLREADLVMETRRGKNRIYRLNAAPLREVDDYLASYRSMWDTKLQSLKKHLESRLGTAEGGN